jgi:hypothetical protein
MAIYSCRIYCLCCCAARFPEFMAPVLELFMEYTAVLVNSRVLGVA